MSCRPAMIILFASALVAVPFLLSRQSPEAKAANRIRNAYLAAERPVVRKGSSISADELKQFLGKLKVLDSATMPPEVQRAFVVFITAVEANVNVRRSGGDVEKADARVNGAKMDFLNALDRWRGEPF